MNPWSSRPDHYCPPLFRCLRSQGVKFWLLNISFCLYHSRKKLFSLWIKGFIYCHFSLIWKHLNEEIQESREKMWLEFVELSSWSPLRPPMRNMTRPLWWWWWWWWCTQTSHICTEYFLRIFPLQRKAFVLT